MCGQLNRHADVILVLDHGRIAETGRHEQLLALGGIYHKLHSLQFRKQAEAPAIREGEGSWLFSVDEIKDLTGIIKRLRQQSDLVSAFLWTQLPPLEQAMLREYQPSEPSLTPAQGVVLHALNKIIEGPGIFEKERFNGVSLRPKTADLLNQNPTGASLAHLNRFLLEDAFPLELARNHGE